ncbi:AfsR/SARP family transcriptional regulator [Kitasatospora sp. NPDC002227]|uniref:AfsR/SARP family transcriptional regulator n=1 Tax=Kitasatospora sp. NPDC002227 TaxID=3154773 RepID=UPI00332C4619
MEFRLLGQFEMLDEDGAPRAIPEGRLRTLLAALLLNAGSVVPADTLATLVWGEALPREPRPALQVMVTRLRRHLGPAGAARLTTARPGYRFTVHPGELDLHRFEELHRAGLAAHAAGDWAGAAEQLGRALDCWRGAALCDIPGETLAAEAAVPLAERRRYALRTKLAAELELGRHAELVSELTLLVAGDPMDEELRAQLVLALHRSGRRADALACYQAARRELVAQLGIEPGAALQELHRAVLADAPELAWRGAAAVPAEVPAGAPAPAAAAPAAPVPAVPPPPERPRRPWWAAPAVALAVPLLAWLPAADSGPVADPPAPYVRRTASDQADRITTELDLPVARPVAAGDTEIVSLLLVSTSAAPVQVTDTAGDEYLPVGDVLDQYGHRTMLFTATAARGLSAGDRISAHYPHASKFRIAADEFQGPIAVLAGQSSAASTRDRTPSSFSTAGHPLGCAAGDLLLAAVGTNSGKPPVLARGEGWYTLPVVRISSYRLTTAFRVVRNAGPCAAAGATDSQWEAVAVRMR